MNAKAATPVFTKLTGGYPDGATANPGYRRITLATGAGAVHNTIFSAMESLVGSQLWGFYKSTDGGATWAHVDNGVNGVASITNGSRVVTRISGTAFSAVMIGHRIIVNNQFSRTVASVTDANTLTVSAQESAFNVTNASVSFSVSSYPLYCDGQCFYDMTVAVDPTDATAATVYVGGNPNAFNQDLAPCPFGPGNCSHYVWRSDTGGTTWRSVSQGDGVSGGLHPDDHDIYLDASTTPARGLRRQRRRDLAFREQGRFLDGDEHEHRDHAVPGRRDSSHQPQRRPRGHAGQRDEHRESGLHPAAGVVPHGLRRRRPGLDRPADSLPDVPHVLQCAVRLHGAGQEHDRRKQRSGRLGLRGRLLRRRRCLQQRDGPVGSGLVLRAAGSPFRDRSQEPRLFRVEQAVSRRRPDICPAATR